jgi:hypothetical protein
MALTSRAHGQPDHFPGTAHGVDALIRLAPPHGARTHGGPTPPVPAPARCAPWGIWSQYNGPSVALGTVAVEGGALRAGRHLCPPEIIKMYAPLVAHFRARQHPGQRWTVVLPPQLPGRPA